MYLTKVPVWMHACAVNIIQLYITNKTERFSFISGRAVRVAELIKEDWPIMLQ